jgi:DnaJ-class molecular chaperone
MDAKHSPETCAWCNGLGEQLDSQRCEVCGGQGSVMVLQPAQMCMECHCTGKTGNNMEVCARCHGSGWEGVLQPTTKGSKK